MSLQHSFARFAVLAATAVGIADPAHADAVTVTDVLNNPGTCSNCGASPYGTVTFTQAAPGGVVDATVQLNNGDTFANSGVNDAFSYSFIGATGPISISSPNFTLDTLNSSDSNSVKRYDGDPFGIFTTRIAYSGGSATVLDFSFSYSGTLSASDFATSTDPKDSHTFVPGTYFEADINDPPVGATNAPMVTPVPEASTWAMVMVGFAGLGFVAYRRQVSFRLV